MKLKTVKNKQEVKMAEVTNKQENKMAEVKISDNEELTTGRKITALANEIVDILEKQTGRGVNPELVITMAASLFYNRPCELRTKS